MLRPTAEFERLVARAGLYPKDMIDRAGISRSTYFGWLRPKTQAPRKGNMREATAWKIAKVYAAAAGVSEDDAFAALFAEIFL